MLVKWTECPVYGNDDGINMRIIKTINIRSGAVGQKSVGQRRVLQSPVLIRSVLCRPALKQNRTEHAETA